MLIVDDDVRNVFALDERARGARDGGAVRRERQGGLEAPLERTRLDLVLMDVMMPEMDGYETMRAIREMAEFARAADHRADRQGDEGRPREEHRGRRLGLHHEAGRHRPAAVADAGVALPVADGQSPVVSSGGPRRARASSRSSCCSRRSTGATASTSASTRRPRCARRLWRASHAEGSPRSRACRSASSTTRAAWSGCCSTCRSTSPRCSATRRFYVGVPRAGRPAAAHVSVHPGLGRRLLDRRGGLLARDPARARRASTTAPDLRDRHQRGGARAARGGRLPARQDAGVHAELHPRRRHAPFSEYYTAQPTTARSSTARSSTTSSSRSTTSSPTARSTSST